MPLTIDWQRAHGGTVVSGDFGVTPEDFVVVEQGEFEFSGDGEHDWLWVEKRAQNTDWVARQLASAYGVPAKDVGYAGLKDRNAVTRQWISVRRSASAPDDPRELDIFGVSVLTHERHRRKLRRGAHRGNSFEITLKNINQLNDNLEQRLSQIRGLGVPNYFGEQRFGHDLGNLDRARELFAGKRLKRQSRSFAISAARSWIFNMLLQQRVIDGSWDRLEVGDCASLDGSNSFFEVEKVDAELADRCLAMDIHPSGPLWGRGDPPVSGKIAELERSVASAEAELTAGLERFASASRRPLRSVVRDLETRLSGNQLTLAFTLSRGAYATSVLRELANVRRPAVQRDQRRSSST